MEIPLNLKLPTKVVDLSLNSIENLPEYDLSGTGSNEFTKTEEFSSEASLFNGSKLGVSWRILDHNRTILITPLELNANKMPGTGCSVKIRLPFTVLDHCTSVFETNDNELVFDLFTTNQQICTFKLPQNYLLTNENLNGGHLDTSLSALLSKHALMTTVDFSSGTVPKLTKSCGTHALVVFLANGNAYKLERDELNGVGFKNVHQLQDQYRSEGLISRLFHLSNGYVPEYPRLSIDAAVQAEHVSSRYLVTLSVDHSLKLWDLALLNCVQKINNGGERMSIKNGVVVTLEDISLHFYKLENQQLVHFQNTPVIDKGLIQWTVAGLMLLDTENLKVLVAHKLNASALFHLYNDGTWHSAGGFDHSHLYESEISTSQSEIRGRISKYSDVVVQCAFKQCVEAAADPVSARSLAAVESHSADINDISDFLNSQTGDINIKWIAFDTECRKLEAKGTNVLNVAAAVTTSSQNFFWLLKASGVSILSLQPSANKEIISGDNGALKFTNILFNNMPSQILKNIISALLSNKLLTTRLNEVCNILRTCLTQSKLREISRMDVSCVGKEILEYLDSVTGVPPNTPKMYNNAGDSKLSEFGRDAIGTLIYELSASHYEKFALLAALCVVAIFEGWKTQGEDYPLILKKLVFQLRRFSMVTQLGAANIDAGVESVDLEKFGIGLAKQVLANASDAEILARALPKIQRTSDLDVYKSAVEQLEETPQTVFLLCLASLKAGKETEAVILAQKVSMARPWVESEFSLRPETQADWLFAIAKYARDAKAHHACAALLDMAIRLCLRDNPNYFNILELAFKVYIEQGNVPAAYTTFTRRFQTAQVEDRTIIADYVSKLIETAAKKNYAIELMQSHPFVGFVGVVDDVLKNTHDFNGILSYKLRYKFHTTHENYAGAAQALYDFMNTEDKVDPDQRINLYILILDAMEAVEPQSRWLMAGKSECRSFEDIKNELHALKVKLSLEN